MGARTPADCDRLFGEHLNAGDLDALVALYEPGAVLVRQDRSAAAGPAAIRAALAPLLESRSKIQMNVVHEVRAGDDLALLYNDWVATSPGADGGPVEARGGAIEVVRRQPDGSWRFVLDDPFARG